MKLKKSENQPSDGKETSPNPEEEKLQKTEVKDLDEVNEEVETKVPWLLSCRVQLALISSLGFLVMYATKVNLSVAIVCMVNHTATEIVKTKGGEHQAGLLNTTAINYTAEGFPNSTRIESTGVSKCGDGSSGEQEDGEFLWSKEVQSIILGSFFYGYIITQVPGGWLAGRFGGKRVFGWFMFLCILATLFTPLAARIHYGFLICLRVLAGIGQGVTWPAMHAIWAFWAPPNERSKLIGFTFAGTQIGNVITFPLAGLLCRYGFDGGWASIFYVLGILGMIWFFAWMLLVSDTPETHRRISQEEKLYIQSSLKGAMGREINVKKKIPWKSLVLSRPVWATVIAHACGNWVTYTFLTTMPAYMKEVLKFDIKSNGFLSAVPYIGMWIFIVISGIVSDSLTKSKKLTVTQARKLFNTLGEFVPALFLIALGFLDCTLWYAAVLFLTIAISFIGCAYSAGYMVNPADIAPQYSSLVFGISNTVATIPGFLGPYTVGQLTPNKSQEEWRYVFYIAAAICIFGNIFYLIFGSGELQEWAKEEENDPAEYEKAIKKTNETEMEGMDGKNEIA